jgi:hypothetical protein
MNPGSPTLQLRRNTARHSSASARYFYLLLGIMVFTNLHVYAYELSLNSASVHEAFLLGQRNDRSTAEFVEPYVKHITATGADGPRRAEIQVLTPFLQVLDESLRHAADYTEERATKDYLARGDVFIVSVALFFPGAYPKSGNNPASTETCKIPALRPENFWKNFQFDVKQRGRSLPVRSQTNEPVYSSQTSGAPAALDGATVSLQFDAKDVSSEMTTVEVTTPACKLITANFDLKLLR